MESGTWRGVFTVFMFRGVPRDIFMWAWSSRRKNDFDSAWPTCHWNKMRSYL